MSTCYRIVGRGKRLTEKKLRKICEESKCIIDEAESNAGHKVINVAGIGYIHHFKGAGDCWNTFVRYGGNSGAAKIWCDILADHGGCDTLSEHDDGFFN